jgi:hypothetical protein
VSALREDARRGRDAVDGPGDPARQQERGKRCEEAPGRRRDQKPRTYGERSDPAALWERRMMSVPGLTCWAAK